MAMKNTLIILAEGFEEVEALTTVDLLRRANVRCDMVSLGDTDHVTGSHGITVEADRKLSQLNPGEYDGLILPGGMPGTKNLAGDERVLRLLRLFHTEGKLTAAICAAPTVLAKAGLLVGKTAVCYPGMEEQLTGSKTGTGSVAVDGTVITSRGLGTAIEFALAIVRYYEGDEASATLAKTVVWG